MLVYMQYNVLTAQGGIHAESILEHRPAMCR
jgi:hypothetical protein